MTFGRHSVIMQLFFIAPSAIDSRIRELSRDDKFYGNKELLPSFLDIMTQSGEECLNVILGCDT